MVRPKVRASIWITHGNGVTAPTVVRSETL